MESYLSGLSSSVTIKADKMITPYYIEHNIFTNDACHNCKRPVSYCFSNIVGVKKWYCGYCAAAIVKVNHIDDIELGLQKLKL